MSVELIEMALKQLFEGL